MFYHKGRCTNQQGPEQHGIPYHLLLLTEGRLQEDIPITKAFRPRQSAPRRVGPF